MQHDITPQQARERLERAEAATGRREADRRVHGLATAGFGLLVGAYLAVSRIVEGTAWEYVVLGVYVVLLLWLCLWQSRAARTWPRHVRRVGRLGLGASMALFVVAVVWLNVRESAALDEVAAPESLAVLVPAGLVVALPMVVAGLVIRRGDER